MACCQLSRQGDDDDEKSIHHSRMPWLDCLMRNSRFAGDTETWKFVETPGNPSGYSALSPQFAIAASAKPSNC
jgi:hypothetical protein